MNEIKYFKQLSSLEKVLLTKAPDCKEYTCASVLKGEEFSYQIAYCGKGEHNFDAYLKVESPLKEYITVKKVWNVPSELPVFLHAYDNDYISIEPCLLPDALFLLKSNLVEINPEKYHSLWISVKLDKSVGPGVYPIDIELENAEEGICERCRFELEVIDAELPEQSLIYTQWFHCDCIADYYKVEVFSERHWQLIDEFMKMASDNGMNMILTPIFTPPLDTEVGMERPTVQLVDIKKDGDKYEFGFDRLLRWIALCKSNNIKYYEMAHLFTQWGAKFTPKIMAYENGEYKRIFGWDVSSVSESYKNFLNQFIPSLIKVLKAEGIDRYTYFHISDEPYEGNMDSYKAAREAVIDLLDGFKVFDALSSFEFYEKGLVSTPVVAVNHINPFIENNVEDLWGYYCCSQCVDVPNRFMAMPSHRNRILALMLYKYSIKGFLQWGYNFYYTRRSRHKIDPYVVTDALNAFPSGDSFIVYPYEDGPIESLRLKVFADSLRDLRALQLLERYMSKDEIVAFIEEGLDEPITFERYPRSADYILSLRERINRMIQKYSCKQG